MRNKKRIRSSLHFKESIVIKYNGIRRLMRANALVVACVSQVVVGEYINMILKIKNQKWSIQRIVWLPVRRVRTFVR